MYWLLTNELVDEDNDADLTGVFVNDMGEVIDFDDGAMVSLPITMGTYTLSEKLRGDLTDHLCIDEVPGVVFSKRLCDVFDRLLIDNIQYFSLYIVDPETGDTYTDHKIANVIGVVDCVDKKRSDIEYFEDGDIEFINKLILDESKIPPELKIFRLSKRTTLLFVHESVKSAIEEAGITGCVFYKPEDYH